MAKFTIYSPTGTALYTGAPSFTGQYMKPGLLEFREICVPSTVELVAGCYVDYTRTGFRYRIYNVPQVKKQARPLSYGAAFVYQGVQLFDASKMLEYCPFRDLVKGDNRIHFSTQPSISTFEGVDGLARRFEACLVDQYGEGSWVVRIATDDENPDLHDLMLEAREFTVSGVNILQCLDKVYEIWPEVGWVYKVEGGVDTIIIGGGGINANEGTYAYGKGNGLTSLTRTVANADEMANRIYAYGDSRNMLPRWYNSQTIKDAESVDIQNLMIPVADWGVTDGLPDASKAYVEDATSIARMGLRPATVYFDGSGEYPAIYPTIRETTIQMVRTALGSSSAQYYPSETVYGNPSQRVDTILSAQATFDSGLAGDAAGKANVEMGDVPFTASGSFTMYAGSTYYPFYHYQGTWEPDSAGTLSISSLLDLSGQVALDGIEKCVVSVKVKDPSYQGSVIFGCEYEISPDEDGVVSLSGQDMYEEKVAVSAVEYVVTVDVSVYMTPQETDKTGTYSVAGNIGIALSNYRTKTFKVSIRQIGFDIAAQSLLGDGKTIAMRSGKCQGRSFSIKSCTYVQSSDSWSLECWRSEDESLSQWFPNTDYPIVADDEFVLLDIAMPEIYIGMAEQKLLAAAEDLLADTATERWQFVPEIDAKYMVENSRTIRAGEFMALVDSDLVGVDGNGIRYFRTIAGDYFLTSTGDRILLNGSGGVARALVDSIVINEGEAAIPTYKVTLRDRKRKTWTASESPSTTSSKPVSNATQTISSSSSSGGGDSFFTLDPEGNVTLKEPYSNLWAPGWVAAGGVGTDESIGTVTSVGLSVPLGLSVSGSPVTSSGTLAITYADGYAIPTVAKQNGWDAKSTVSISNTIADGTTGYARIATITIDGVSVNINAPADGGGGGGGGSETDPIFTNSAAYNITTSDIAAWNAKSNFSGNYNDLTNKPTIPTVSTSVVTDKTSNTKASSPKSVYDYAEGTFLKLAGGTITGGLHIGGAITGGGSGDPYWMIEDDGSAEFDNVSASNGVFSSLTVNGSTIDWFVAETINGTLTLKLNPRYAGLWASGWIAAGGSGTGSGGGGGSSVSWGTEYGYAVPLTVEGVTKTLLMNGALLGYATQTWVLQNAVPSTGGTITGGDLNLVGGVLNGYADATDYQQDEASWYVDRLGQAVFYTLSVGGVSVTPSNYVTLTTTQTISGAKTFSANVTVGSDIVPGTDIASYLGSASKRFHTGHIVNMETRTVNFHNATNGKREQAILGGYGYLSFRVGTDLDDAQSAYKQVTFHPTYGLYPEQTGVNLGNNGANYRWSCIYGVDANLTGDLSLAQTSHIDIGPLRIEYDSVNKALHITKKSNNDTNNYGIYADGFVSAGGVPQSA